LSEDYDLKQYEIKPFDSFPVGGKKENMVVFALPQEGGMKKSVFNLVDCSGNFLKFEGPDDIMEKASEKASMLEREAYEKGFAQGEKDGLELGAAKALKVVENIENLLNEIGCLRTEIINCMKKILSDLFVLLQKKWFTMKLR